MSSFDVRRLLASLNDAQRMAATHPEGPLEVIAGPGSGKTRTLVARICWLIATGQAQPSEICALAFMNDAAREVRERLAEQLGSEVVSQVTATTTHRLAHMILRDHAGRFGRAARTSIWTAEDGRRALSATLADRERSLDAATVLARARYRAQRVQSPWQAAAAAHADERSLLVDGLLAYEHAKRASSAWDFDDLLSHAVVCLESDDLLRVRRGRRFGWVLIDEVQDLNPAQMRLALLLASAHRNLTIVGDPQQAICSWRGATSAENFAAFANAHPGRTTVALERCYRCSPQILAAADRLLAAVRQERHHAFCSATAPGARPLVVSCEDERDEASQVASWAKHHRADGAALSELAVLMRVNEQARHIEQALMRARVPCRIVGATGFAERAEVRDALAALRLVVNPHDRLAFARAARAAGAGVGAKSIAVVIAAADRQPGASLLELAADGRLDELGPQQRAALREWGQGLRASAVEASIGAQVRRILVASGQPDRLHRALEPGRSADTQLRALDALERLRDLVRLADDYQLEADQPTLADFVATVALGSAEGHRDADAEAVSLLTVHRAKGLEFTHVWIAGMEEGLFPHARAIQEAGEGEERRLAYVAMTRAKRTLTLSWARSRRDLAQEASRFLNGLCS
jgi:DNA helicase-2/ATP-dependent DNA helicase PcrA